jgi:hypothetical protein
MSMIYGRERYSRIKLNRERRLTAFDQEECERKSNLPHLLDQMWWFYICKINKTERLNSGWSSGGARSSTLCSQIYVLLWFFLHHFLRVQHLKRGSATGLEGSNLSRYKDANAFPYLSQELSSIVIFCHRVIFAISDPLVRFHARPLLPPYRFVGQHVVEEKYLIINLMNRI